MSDEHSKDPSGNSPEQSDNTNTAADVPHAEKPADKPAEAETPVTDVTENSAAENTAENADKESGASDTKEADPEPPKEAVTVEPPKSGDKPKEQETPAEAEQKTAGEVEQKPDPKPVVPQNAPEVIFIMARDPFFAARLTPVARSIHVPLKVISDLGLLRLETADKKRWRLVIEAKTFQRYRDMLQQLAEDFPSDGINAIVVGKRQVIEMINGEMDLPDNILVIDTPIFISCMDEIIVHGRVPDTRPGPEYLQSLSVESEDPRLKNDRPQQGGQNRQHNGGGKGKKKSRPQKDRGGNDSRNDSRGPRDRDADRKKNDGRTPRPDNSAARDVKNEADTPKPVVPASSDVKDAKPEPRQNPEKPDTPTD